MTKWHVINNGKCNHGAIEHGMARETNQPNSRTSLHLEYLSMPQNLALEYLPRTFSMRRMQGDLTPFFPTFTLMDRGAPVDL